MNRNIKGIFIRVQTVRDQSKQNQHFSVSLSFWLNRIKLSMSVLGCSGIWELKYNSTNKTLEFRDQKELCSHEQLILLPHEQRPQHQVLLLLPGVLQPLEHQGQRPLRLLQIQKDAKKGGRCTIEQQPCQVMLSNNHTCSLAPSAALTPPALVAQLGTPSFSSVSSELPGPSRASLRLLPASSAPCS